MQRVARPEHRRVGGVVGFAQVHEHDATQSAMRGAGDQSRRRAIRQVPELPANALLEWPRIRAIGQHPFVMIGFHDQQVASGKGVRQRLGHMTEVHCDAHTCSARAIGQNQRGTSARIMRHGHTMHVESADIRRFHERQRGHVLRQPIRRRRERLERRLHRVHGPAPSCARADRTARVIGVFMCQQQRADVIRATVRERETFRQRARAKPRVHQDAAIGAIDENGVPFAPTAEHRDAEHVKRDAA